VIPDDVSRALDELKPPPDEATRAAMDRYLDLLLAANQEVNLTGIRDKDEAWVRHILDSLLLLPALRTLPEGAQVIDVGSGGGLPGIPLALARPDLAITLLEATRKKARRLEGFVEALELPRTRVLSERAETLAHRPAHRQRYQAVVTRAVARLPALLELTLPFLQKGGVLLAMKGQTAPAEIAEASRAMAKLGGGSVQKKKTDEGWIVRIIKEDDTKRSYPRPPGHPVKMPL